MTEARTITLEALPHQVAFWSNETPGAHVALVGPLGTGKTRSLVVKCLLLRRHNHGLPDMIVEPTYRMVQDVLVPAFEEIVRGEFGIKVTWNKSDADIIWPAEFGGGRTHLRSADDPDRLTGTNLFAVGFDEPGKIGYDSYRRAADRARHPRAGLRQVYLTGSPEGITWYADEFDDPKPPHVTIRARCWHRTMAHYPGQLARTYGASPELLAAYLEGRFVPMFAGRAYRPFDRRVHVEEAMASGQLGYLSALPLVLACDFNVDAMRWEVCQAHTGQLQVLDEIALPINGSVQAAAREFVRRWSHPAGVNGQHRGQLIVTGDAAGKSRTHTGTTSYDVLLGELQPHFNVRLQVSPANPLQRDRVETVNYHLGGSGHRVLIHPRCVELIKDLERNTWKPGSPEIAKSNVPPENLRTHAGDAFGYFVYGFAPIPSPVTTATATVCTFDPTYDGGIMTMDF